MLVVDQLSEPLLERYEDLFAGGFRTLLTEGRFYVNAAHDHAATVTAPGHATLATGVYPSRHGIVGNEWFEKVGDGRVAVSNVGDSGARIVGHPDFPGVSPRRLLRSGLAEWLQDADPGSLVASVSPKDRAAVLPAGRSRAHVYWFEPKVGRFVTSTFHAREYPVWVDRFHGETLPAYRADTVWASAVPQAARGRSSADTAEYEGDGTHTYFPHRFAAEGNSAGFWVWFADTPMLDALTLDFARTMISAAGLGRDSIPDLLSVSLSATDRVGHEYGPLSREQLDNLLRLDRQLEAFFDFLDSKVGPDRWAVALSADHGAAFAPEDLQASGDTAARRWTPEEEAALSAVRSRVDRSVHGNATPERTVAALESLDFVADAWTLEELLQDPPADSFSLLLSRSVYPGRVSGDFGRQGVLVRFEENWVGRARGVGHGTPYWPDRHVPMIFMGPGITAGRDSLRISAVDFAPTLARLLKVPFPDDLDGVPLEGVIGEGHP